MVTGSEILPVASLVARIIGPKRRRRRVMLAKRIQAVRAFSLGASDSDLWNRIGDELPEWAHSGVVAPVTVDGLHRCLTQLDPANPGEEAQRNATRGQLRTILDGLYLVLISSDRATRSFRGARHAFGLN